MTFDSLCRIIMEWDGLPYIVKAAVESVDAVELSKMEFIALDRFVRVCEQEGITDVREAMKHAKLREV